MSGHSKWSTIKRKKGAKDAQRSKVFSKLIKEITVAARLGGGDVNGNPRLRLAVARARGANMPHDNIKKAIDKGTGDIDGAIYEEILYEAYGPGGVAIMIESMTENRNRTAMDVRFVLDKHGGNLGQPGTVAHLFTTSGYLLVDAAKVDEDALLAAALDGGASDVRRDGDSFEVLTAPQMLEPVTRALEGAGIAYESAEIARLPLTTVTLQGSKAQTMLKLLERMEDLDDVQKVYANFDISEEDLAKIE
jgi:YebC/PmpR family DNA-binding regulatory protein